jgi:NAD(P)-dependent dehydrogenase (short-subunit alcohol dehydrogenase family)
VADIPATPGTRTIVMTGAADGAAAAALRRIAADPATRLIVGARHPTPMVAAGVDMVALDLTRCDSVHAFAEAVTRRLGRTRIDALVLDTAGTPQHTHTCLDHTTEPGHLAHHLLARLLAAHLADNARVILLTGIAPGRRSWTARLRASAASRLRDLLPTSPTGAAAVASRGVTVLAHHPAGTGGGRAGKALARLTTGHLPDLAARKLRNDVRNRHGH